MQGFAYRQGSGSCAQLAWRHVPPLTSAYRLLQLSWMTKKHTHTAEIAEYGYNVVFERQADGAYVATVPSLNYISTYGESLEEARAMVKDMLALYLQSLQEDGLEIPEPDTQTTVTERISVALSR